MADSFTPNLNLRKPEVGAAFDTWGGVIGLNADMDVLDAVFLASGLSTVAAPVGQPFAGVPGVGLRIGKGKVLNVEGQVQLKDPTDVTKVGTISSDLIPTATTVDLKYPPAGGTIATKEILVATVAASHPVGTILSGYYGTPPSGYIFVDGRTIGDATSLATNRANDDCQRLFLHLWGLGMAVVGGRGASAAADWAAHKQLTLPNHSGRTMAGRDNLSGTAAGIITGFTTLAQVGGQQNGATGAFSMSGVNGINFGNQFFNFQSGSGYISSAPTTIGNGTGPAFSIATVGDNITLNAFAGYTTINGNFNIGVSGASNAFNIVQPTIAVDVIIAL